MIWNSLKKNRLAGVLSFLILSVLFSFFGFTSRSYADSIIPNYFTFRVAQNYNSTAESNFFTTSSMSGVHSFESVRPPYNGNTWSYDSRYTYRFTGGMGMTNFVFSTQPVYFAQNNITAHFEINLVSSYSTSGSTNTTNWRYYNNILNSLSLRSCNVSIGTQNVDYAITDWDSTWQSGTQVYFSKNRTLTVYIDVVFKDLIVGQSQAITCAVDGGGILGYQYPDGNKTTYNFIEKFQNNYTFYNTYNDALTAMTNTILDRQILIQQEQMERDQQDRDNIENRANDSEDEGENASQNAQNASTPLIGAITQIYSIVMNPHATDCDIGPINLYNQMDLGTLDMCTFSIPQPLMAIGALLTIGLILLLAWSVLHCAIALYKDLFGK